ncbi:hypothetical protein llap_21355 [Limosa lapponica baueri]|uniref:Reverse transcriptase domain-containing protein n=1 Tax=Limosa lapponica baueri TaxID=1758121 RepID=A0A2I0T3H0_LIMLA|nr:hypothetical protein llap_21355 [Limosa lapponica baueri]
MQEEDSDAEIVVKSFSMKGLRNMRKDFSRQEGGSQELTVLEAKVSLTGNKWEKHPNVTGPAAPCILGINHLKRGYFKDAKGLLNLIRQLETQGVISKTRSPFNSPIWPVRKSDRDWRLIENCGSLNEVTPPLSAAVTDVLQLQDELESKAAKCCATIDIANAFFSIPLAAECRPQFAFTWRGIQ